MNTYSSIRLMTIVFMLAACQTETPSPTPNPQPGETPLPTATLLPPSMEPSLPPVTLESTSVPLATPIKPLYVNAICTSIGKDLKTYVPSGTPIVIMWGWNAKTESQINDHIENNISTITLDGKIIDSTSDSGLQLYKGLYEIVWYSDVGILAPGQHTIMTDTKWKKKIDDGMSTYGPGGEHETEHDECQIIVEEAPASAAPSGPGVAETPPQAASTLGIGSTQVRPQDGMVMVYVPAGSFSMGSDRYDVEKPIQEITLEAFWIDQTEVTNTLFQKFVQAQAYRTDAETSGISIVRNITSKTWEKTSGADWQHPQGPQSNLDGLWQHPVVNVSWNDATAYCTWAGGRLPSEAEWEKAARGEDGRTYPWGETAPDPTLLNFTDVYLGKKASDGYLFTVPVGSYPTGVSPYGAYDMAGNVWEWVGDWFTAYPGNPVSDPNFGTKSRVLRGGSWFNPPDIVRSAYRFINIPSGSSTTMGFRCAIPK
jgi:formylglycine-generating enzyme required for sulfatase activity